MPSKKPQNRYRLLITGFGPFGNIKKNPSERLVKRLWQDGIKGADVHARVFPVSYSAVDRAIPDALMVCDFEVILMLGVAAGERKIRLERFGRNRDFTNSRDVEGNRQEGPIARGAKAKLETKVNVETLRKLLRENGIRCRISEDAGGFLCNHAYYVAQGTLSHLGSRALCLFVHVPCDRKTLKGAKPRHTMPFKKQCHAVRLIAESLCRSAKRSDA